MKAFVESHALGVQSGLGWVIILATRAVNHRRTPSDNLHLVVVPGHAAFDPGHRQHLPCKHSLEVYVLITMMPKLLDCRFSGDMEYVVKCNCPSSS